MSCFRSIFFETWGEYVIKIYLVIFSKIYSFKQVVAVQYNVVKPRSSDVNENLLSEVARNQFGLTEEQVKNGQPLEHVLEEVFHFKWNFFFQTYVHHMRQKQIFNTYKILIIIDIMSINFQVLSNNFIKNKIKNYFKVKILALNVEKDLFRWKNRVLLYSCHNIDSYSIWVKNVYN